MRLRQQLTTLVTCIGLAAVNMIGSEVVAEWNFNDKQNPGKATVGVGALVHGKPEIVDSDAGKVLKLHGGNITDKKVHDYLEVMDDPKLNLGDSSFSVECWVKPDDINYYQFVGKRITARPAYKQKGWSLGMERGGGLSFVIDDGGSKTKRSYAYKHFLSCPWDTDDWNYLVGVRDREKKEVRLYVNGELVAKAEDKAGSVSNDCSIRIGYDQETGVFLDGKINDIKITRGALSDAMIKANFSFKLQILPQPQEMVYSKEIVPLKKSVTVVIPEKPTVVELTAHDLIKKELKNSFDVDVHISSEVPEGEGTVLEIGRTKKELHPEAYELIKESGKNRIQLISNDNGVIYGALTLIQLLKQTAVYNKQELAYPRSFSIYDYPIIANRIATGGIYYKLDQLDRICAQFDKRMYQRLNAIVISPKHIKNESMESVKRVIREATRRGITVWAVISFHRAKEGGLNPLNEADRQLLIDFYQKAGKAGCGAFGMFIDDITAEQSRVVLQGGVAEKFQKKIGLLQREFVKLMVDEGRTFKIKKFMVCPTPYMRGWQRSSHIWWGRNGIEHAQYFKDLTDAPGLEDVRVFHCEFFPDKLEELRKAGLKKYAYWVNGLWTSKTWFSWNVGPAKLALTWYGFLMDEDNGPQPLPEAQEHWRNIGKQTDTVFLGTGSAFGFIIGGIWLWNPPAFNDDKAVEYACNQIFGPGGYEQILNYSHYMAPFVGLFKTYKTKFFNECHPEVIKRKKPITAEQLRQYWQNLKKAEKAFGKLEKIGIADDSLLGKSCWPATRIGELKSMRYAIDKARLKLKAKMKRKRIAVED